MIKCDICNEDVTPNYMDSVGQEYSLLKLKGDKICLCMDCESAICEWLDSKECKAYCLAFKKEMEKYDRKK